MSAARVLLAACLLTCSVLATAESIKVHLSQTKAKPEFLEAWYQVPPDAQPTDRIALYASDVKNISSVDPIRYVFVPSSLSAANSRATAQLWTNSYGRPLQAVYARGPSHDTAQALSTAPLANSNSNMPAQGRLSVGASAGEIRVTWTTREGSAPVVKFGTASGVYSQQRTATYSTYGAADICSQPASAWGYSSPGVINTAVLKGLAPNTTYYYVFGEESWGWSEEASFTTPPAASSTTPVRLLVTADLGIDSPDGAELPDDVSIGAQLKSVGSLIPPGSSEYNLLKAALLATGQLTPAPGSTATRQLMQQLLNSEKPYHGLLMLGGLSMAVGHGAMWDDLLQQMQPVLTRVPLAAASGDTEAADPALPGSAFVSAASGGECGVPYSQRLRMPHTAATEMWYSVNVGAVHLVMLNSEQTLAVDSPQYRWLKSDLTAVDRSKTPWVVVGMHRGMYVDDPTDAGPGSPSVTLQQQIERLLVEKSVDLVLNGHARLYHHSCPIVQGHCVGYDADGTAKGPVHAMLGIGGAAMPLRAQAEKPFWVVEESFEHGVAQLVADKTSLTLQVTSSRTGKDLSSFTLTKPAAWKPDPAAASQRFTTLQQSTPQQPTIMSAMAAVTDGDSAAVAVPDFEGLSQLLQEDLLAAAAGVPSVLEKFAGRSSYLAKVVASLAAGEAPAPTTTWQTTMQLLQLALNTMTTPAGVQPMPPGPQDPSLPTPQEPIPDPPTMVMPPVTPSPANPDPNPQPIPQPSPQPWAPNPDPPMVPGPPVEQPALPPPQQPMVPPPQAPLPGPQEPLPAIPPRVIPTQPLPGTPQVPSMPQPVMQPQQPMVQPQQPAVVPQQPVPLQQPAAQPAPQQPAQQVTQPPIQQAEQQPQPAAQPNPQQGQPGLTGPVVPSAPHNFTSSFPKTGHRKPHRSWSSPERPVTQPNRPTAGSGRGAGHRGSGSKQPGGQQTHDYYGYQQYGFHGNGGEFPQPCNDPACCEGDSCGGGDGGFPPCEGPDCGVGEIPPCTEPACCDGPDCTGGRPGTGTGARGGGHSGSYYYHGAGGNGGGDGWVIAPDCTDPACGCDEGDPNCGGRRNGANTAPADKISAPGSKKDAGQAKKPIGDGAKTDPRFHYGQWYQRQQQQQAIARRGRPLPRPTAPVRAPEPTGRASKRLNIPKKAWGDPTGAPLLAESKVEIASVRQEEVVVRHEEPVRGGRARVMHFGRPDDNKTNTPTAVTIPAAAAAAKNKPDVAATEPAKNLAATATATASVEHVETPATGAGRTLKSAQLGLMPQIAKPAAFSLQDMSEAAATVGTAAINAATVAGRVFGKLTKAQAQANEKRAARTVEAEANEGHSRKAKLAKWEEESKEPHRLEHHHAHHPHHDKHAHKHGDKHSHHKHPHHKDASAAAATTTGAAREAPAVVMVAPAAVGKDATFTALPVATAATSKLAPAPLVPIVRAEIEAMPQPMKPVLSRDFNSQQQDADVGDVIDISFDASADGSSTELVAGQKGGRVVQAMQLPQDLTLIKADGSVVPEGTVAAFKYVWQLLQGRLLMGDPSTLLQFQPGWSAGWVVRQPNSVV